MNSIRSYLGVRLLVGFMLLLSLASTLVYLISERILEADFDSRLFAKAQAIIASTSQKGSRLDVDWSNLPQEMGSHGKKPNLIEFLDTSGAHLEGESFLNGSLVSDTNRATYRNAISKQGEKIRVFTLPFVPSVEKEDAAITPPSIRKPCLLVVGSDRHQLDHSLGLMAGVLAVMTVLTSILSLGIVTFVLRRGLQPLASLSDEVGQITEVSLDKRIDLHFLPIEVLPVAEKLNDLLSRLETSFARERRFSSDVSHELRTPVAELKLLSEVMLQGGKYSPEVQQAFEDARDIAGQMEALVTVLLEMVRQEAGCTPLFLSDVNLEAIVQTVWKKLEAKAINHRILLKVASPDKVIMFRAEPRLLAMVLANLLDNAIEYSPTGSVVDVGFQQVNEFPCMVISNPAEKLAPSDLPHLFERFWRKDSARGESDHFGIGLALTRTLCQRLGIHLTVSMDKGNLVRFWLHFSTKETSRNL